MQRGGINLNNGMRIAAEGMKLQAKVQRVVEIVSNGGRALNNQQYDSAITLYEQALNLSKDTQTQMHAVRTYDIKTKIAHVYGIKGQDSYGHGNTKDALNYFNKGIEIIGFQHLVDTQSKDIWNKLTAAKKAVEDHIVNLDINQSFEQIGQMINSGDLGSALAMCNQALFKHPTSELFLFLKHTIFTSAEMIATARFNEANTLLEQQNLYTAIEKLQQSIGAFEVMLLGVSGDEHKKALIKTNISKVLFKLGNTYSISGDIESALVTFDKILGGGKYSSEEPMKSETIVRKIQLLLTKISNAESSQVGLSIIPEITQLSSALLNIDTTEIISQAQNMWRLHDDGMRLLAEGKRDEALQKFLDSHAIQINPTNLKAIVSTLCDIYYENGDRHLASSDWSGAVAEYTECIKLNPSSPHYRIKLAEALAKIDSSSATIAAKQAIELGATGDDLKFAHELVSTSHVKVEFDDLKKMHVSNLYVDLILLSNDAVAVIVDKETGRTAMDRISESQISKLLETVNALQQVSNLLPMYYVSSDGVLLTRETLLLTMMNVYNVLGTYAEYHDRLDDADHYYDNAIEYARLLEHKTAIDIFTAKNHTLAGVKFQKSGDYARAVDEYNTALELNPGAIETRERMEDILQNHLKTPSVDLCIKCVTENNIDGAGVVKACDGVIKMTASNLADLCYSAMDSIQQCTQELWRFAQSHPEIAVACACNIVGQNFNMLIGDTATGNALGSTGEF